ncbi:Gfo/Idh/MocA family protein [Mammaliicoccus lentus]|jgi:predicted dehydrogenase|uniref:Gfo/Idh/MocA family protein n=1 Tax=Mammaliicoccus lentus TaxID=42858 RepID=UPI003519C867
MNKLKVGVIGLGVMGEQHAKILSELPQVELLGVCDLDKNLATSIGENLDTKAYFDTDELLNLHDLNAVLICTSDHLHKDIALKAIEKGVNIFIEKPLADTNEDAEEIIKAYEKSNVRLMVGHTLHWDPRYFEASKQFESGVIGEPIHLFARRNNSIENGERLKGRTSVIKFLGVHDLEAIEWITQDKIIEVYATAVYKRLKKYNTPDTIITNFKLSSGAIGSYETTWALPENHVNLDAKLDIVGTSGVLNINIVNQNINVYTNESIKYPDPITNIDLYGKQAGILKEELSTFVNNIIEDKEFPISVNQAHRAIKIVEAVEESIELGQPVRIEP